MTILEILEGAVARSASDILIIAGMPAAYKIHGLIRRGSASSRRIFRPWWKSSTTWRESGT